MRNLLAVCLLAAFASAQSFPEDWLVIGRVGRGGRAAVHTDAIEQSIVLGTWQAPVQGGKVEGAKVKEQTWQAAKLVKGRVAARRGGYAFCTVESPEDRTVLLRARGHSAVYVNGVQRTGNPYRTGWYLLPVELRKGANEFLFRSGRGAVDPAFEELKKPVFLYEGNKTMPDLIVGKAETAHCGLVMVNALSTPISGYWLAVGDRETPLPTLPPLCTRKITLPIDVGAADKPGDLKVKVRLMRRTARGPIVLDETTLGFRVRPPTQLHQRTFVSEIDGSVQYYAVQPALADNPRPALYLSLHGAGVQGRGQAAAYSRKPNGHIVSPTNRRPYGFDWEDWGRIDALEVLAHARKDLGVDDTRIYLTGHSMGGHGTWSLGALFPSKFAAIGPSAGWVSFFSYGGGRRFDNATPIEAMLQRAASQSDTLAHERNLAALGVYILHGDKDNNVPIREARTMAKRLREFHHDFRFHSQPGAGHWWDDQNEPGAGCVDWQPMFDFFARHRLPRDVELRYVDFTTVNPAVSAHTHWATIETQARSLEPSRVQIRCDPGRRRFVGSTENVLRLALRTVALAGEGKVTIELDGGKLEAVAAAELHLERGADGWQLADFDPNAKSSQRAGPFRQAFNHRFVLVAGTKGSDAETRQCIARARFDVTTFWYRGNGGVDFVLDRDFKAADFRGRNVILYGNAKTNAAWQTLLGHCPVVVEPGRVRLGKRVVLGDDLACLLCYPKPGEPDTLVGAVAGTGLEGMRLTERLNYFVSGVHFPDVFVADPSMLTQGSKGVRLAGFFGPDWGVESGDFVEK